MHRQNLFVNNPPVLLEKQNTLSEESEIAELSNAIISSLLFADHLAVFSLLQHGLQEKLDILEKNCRQCYLELNLKKTRVIII